MSFFTAPLVLPVLIGLLALLMGAIGLLMSLDYLRVVTSVLFVVTPIFGVIVAALAVAFLGQAAGAEKPEQLLNYGGGIALVIVALAVFMNLPGKKKKPEGEEDE